jgi:hypothetical protein
MLQKNKDESPLVQEEIIFLLVNSQQSMTKFIFSKEN